MRAASVAHADNMNVPNVARARLLTPAELAEWLHVERSYIYEHAVELGAMRLGAGPRARLRFDPEEVRRLIACPASRESVVEDPAPQAVPRSGRRRGSGTTVGLLPIRGAQGAGRS